MLKNQTVEPKVKMVLKEVVLRDAKNEDYDLDSGKFSVEPQTMLNWLNTNCFLFDVEFIGNDSKEWFVEQLSSNKEFRGNLEEERIKDTTFTGKNLAIADYILNDSVFPIIKDSKGLIKVYLNSKGVLLNSAIYSGEHLVNSYNGCISKKDKGVCIEGDANLYSLDLITSCNFMDICDVIGDCTVNTFLNFIKDLTSAINNNCIEWL